MESVMLTSNACTLDRWKSAPVRMFTRHRKLQDKMNEMQRRFSNSSLLMMCRTKQFIQCRAGKPYLDMRKVTIKSRFNCHRHYSVHVAVCYQSFIERRQ